MEHKTNFKYLSLFVDSLIKMFPKSVMLRVQSSYIQSEKLKNEFKSIFELMKCQNLSPSMQHRFFIFRRRLKVEKVVIMRNQANLNLGDRVDPFFAYKYEK
jgi:hypothetical protein